MKASRAGSRKEWQTVIRRAKEKYIGTDVINGQKVIRPHYHLDFLGRDPDVTPKVPGAICAVVLPYLARAQQDQLSVWLEPTSEEVMRLYLVYGYRVLEEITVGKGVVDGRGRMVNIGKKGEERKGEGEVKAEGVKAWLTLVDNHKHSLKVGK